MLNAPFIVCLVACIMLGAMILPAHNDDRNQK